MVAARLIRGFVSVDRRENRRDANVRKPGAVLLSPFAGVASGTEGVEASSLDCVGTTPELDLLSLTLGSLMFSISRFESDPVV